MKALVLTGGSGKEMLPLSKYQPKTMLQLHGKYILQYVLDGLLEAGIDEFIIVIGYIGDQIRSLIGEYRLKGINIQTIDQMEKKGIEGAILAAQNYFPNNEAFLLAYGDIIAPSMFYQHLINTYINTAADGAIAITLVGKSAEFGVASIDARGFITEIMPEIPKENTGVNYIFAGASILPVEVFEILKEEKKLALALSRLLKEQRRLCASIWQNEWIDIGYPWDLLAANRDIFKNLEYARVHKSAKISPSAHVSGVVLIEKNAIIDHNAKIVGPCFIGENSYIGTNSLIRDCASIEKNSIIGYSVEVKNSVIQPETKIGRLSFVGDSVIGEKVQLGAGVTTMNSLVDLDPTRSTRTIKGRVYNKLGAIIGPQSSIGANTVMLPCVTIDYDQIVPPGSVIEKQDKKYNFS